MPKFDNLTEAEVKVAELHFKGHTLAEISEQVGVSVSTVFRWVHSGKLAPMLDKISEDLQRAVRRRLVRSSMKAAEAAVAVLDSPDDGKKLAAAFGILDRTGHPKAERMELSADVRASGSVTVDPSDELAAMLAGGGE